MPIFQLEAHLLQCYSRTFVSAMSYEIADGLWHDVFAYLCSLILMLTPQ
jgi:hypothetical protein